MATDGSQWFAIFSAGTGDLVSTGNVVTFPLGTGLRAVTVDGPQNGRYWDKATLNFMANPPIPPPPPSPAPDPFPYREQWVKANLVFTNYVGAAAQVVFPSGAFTVAPLIDGIEQNVTGEPSSTSYLQFTTGNLTRDGVTVWARAAMPLNYTIPIVVHAVQRYKESA